MFERQDVVLGLRFGGRSLAVMVEVRVGDWGMRDVTEGPHKPGTNVCVLVVRGSEIWISVICATHQRLHSSPVSLLSKAPKSDVLTGSRSPMGGCYSNVIHQSWGVKSAFLEDQCKKELLLAKC